jgi:hypothetical protein
MFTAVILALSFALLATVLALGREVRLRRALERLLRHLLSHFRSNSHEAPGTDSGHSRSDRDGRLRRG